MSAITVRGDEACRRPHLRPPYYDGVVTALPDWEYIESEDATVGTITLTGFGMFVNNDDLYEVIR